MMHLIQKQTIELKIDSEEAHHEISSIVQKLANKVFPALLATILDKYDLPKQKLRIDQIELDLGSISREDLETALPNALAMAFEKEIAQIAQQAQSNTEVKWLKQDQVASQALEEFLLTGIMPWWVSEPDLDSLFEQVIQESPHVLRALIYRVAVQGRVRKRIVYQFSEETLDRLFQVLTPQQAYFFKEYITDLVIIQEQETVVSEETGAFKKVIQELTLKYLVEHKNAQDQQQFFETNLQELSQKYSIELPQLVKLLSKRIDRLQHLMKGHRRIAQMTQIFTQKLAQPNRKKSQYTEDFIAYLKTGLRPSRASRQVKWQTIKKAFSSDLRTRGMVNIKPYLSQSGVKERLLANYSIKELWKLLPNEQFILLFPDKKFAERLAKLLATKLLAERIFQLIARKGMIAVKPWLILFEKIERSKLSASEKRKILKRVIASSGLGSSVTLLAQIQLIQKEVEASSAKSQEEFQKVLHDLWRQGESWQLASTAKKAIEEQLAKTDVLKENTLSLFEWFLQYLSTGMFPVLTRVSGGIDPQQLTSMGLAFKEGIGFVMTDLPLYFEGIAPKAPPAFWGELIKQLQYKPHYERFVTQLGKDVFIQLLAAVLKFSEAQFTEFLQQLRIFPEAQFMDVGYALINLAYVENRKGSFVAWIKALQDSLSYEVATTFRKLMPQQLLAGLAPLVQWVEVEQADEWLRANEWEWIPVEIQQLYGGKQQEWQWIFEELGKQLADRSELKLLHKAFFESFVKPVPSLPQTIAWQRFWNSLPVALVEDISSEVLAQPLPSLVKHTLAQRMKSKDAEEETVDTWLLDFILTGRPPRLREQVYTQSELVEYALRFLRASTTNWLPFWKENPASWQGLIGFYEGLSAKQQKEFIAWFREVFIPETAQKRTYQQVIELQQWLLETKLVHTEQAMHKMVLPLFLEKHQLPTQQRLTLFWEVFALLLSIDKEDWLPLSQTIKRPPKQWRKVINNWYQASQKEPIQDLFLVYFLLNQKEWWMPVLADHWYETRLSATESMPQRAKAYFQKHYTEQVGKQLIHRFSQQHLEELVLRFFPEMGGVILSQVLLFERLLLKERLQLGGKSVKEAVWQSILDTLFTRSMTSFDLNRFIHASVKQFAKALQETTQTVSGRLRGLATEELAQGEVRFAVLVELLPRGEEQIREREMSEQELVEQNEDSGRTEKQDYSEQELVIYYFRFGVFPEGEVWSAEAFRLMTLRVMRKMQYGERIALIKLLQKPSLQKKYLQVMGQEGFGAVVSILHPTKYDLVRQLKADLMLFLPAIWRVGATQIEDFCMEQLLLLLIQAPSSLNYQLLVLKVMEGFAKKAPITQQVIVQRAQEGLQMVEGKLSDQFVEAVQKALNVKDTSEAEEEEAQIDDQLYINNAGLVLVHPFLSRFFKSLGLLEGKEFVSEEQTARAVHLLQFLVTNETETAESELVLNKLLCAVPFNMPIPKEITLTEEEKNMCQSLLQGVKANWPKMKGTSVQGLQETFLQREGVLTESEDFWQLRVEKKAYDLLLNSLPWRISTVKLPWMSKPIFVEWEGV